MARLTAKEFQEKHARRMKAAIPDMQAGIEKVSVAPTAKAADKQDKMKSRLLERIEDGTWARRLRSVSLEDWKEKTIKKGLPRVASGIDGAAAKVEDFAGQLLPFIDKQVEEIKKMPDMTIEDSINRMTTFVRGMSKFRKI